jgi:hypothetical protein
MAVIIDNFLHQNFVPKLFMSYQPVRTALTRLFPQPFSSAPLPLARERVLAM